MDHSQLEQALTGGEHNRVLNLNPGRELKLQMTGMESYTHPFFFNIHTHGKVYSRSQTQLRLGMIHYRP